MEARKFVSATRTAGSHRFARAAALVAACALGSGCWDFARLCAGGACEDAAAGGGGGSGAGPDLAATAARDLGMSDLAMADLAMSDLGPCGGRCAPSACMNGRCVATLVSPATYAGDIAADGTSVYWMSTNVAGTTTYLTAANPDGSGARTLATAMYMGGFAVGDTVVYWTDKGTCPYHSDGVINSVSKSGGTSTPIATGEYCPIAPSTNGTTLAWITSNSTTDHTGVSMLALGGPGTAQPLSTGLLRIYHLAFDANALYAEGYTDLANVLTGGAVVRHPLTGGGDTSWTMLNSPQALAVDGMNVYWSDPGTLWRAALPDGTPAKVGNGSSATTIASDGTNLYLLDGTKLIEVPLGGGTATTLWDNGDPTGGTLSDIAFDASYVYWTFTGRSTKAYADSYVMRSEK
jgi:hypothetical protein